MKTIDIAREYLENLDLSSMDIYAKKIVVPETIQSELDRIKYNYDRDNRNTFSNDYYRSICLEVILCERADASHKMESCFRVACDIVRDTKVTWLSKKWHNTNYPQAIFDKWNAYCAIFQSPPYYLREDSEIKNEMLMTAWHYIKDKES